MAFKMTYKNKSGVLSILATAVLIISFQNFSVIENFDPQKTKQQNLACTGSLCIASDSKSIQESCLKGSRCSAPVVSSQKITGLRNIISSTGKRDCEDSIASVYSKKISCTLGGGCGIDCGKPNQSCVSANPEFYGACLAQSDFDSATVAEVNELPATELLYNFIFAEKSSCESAIRSKYGVLISCAKGGSCGLECGKPGADCSSSSPNSYGACINSADVLAARESGFFPEITLVNFVAGDKIACEASVRNSLKVSAECSLGGGCGDCGIPNATCTSVNPQLWGACIRN